MALNCAGSSDVTICDQLTDDVNRRKVAGGATCRQDYSATSTIFLKLAKPISPHLKTYLLLFLSVIGDFEVSFYRKHIRLLLSLSLFFVWNLFKTSAAEQNYWAI